jgi:acetyl-CoA acyltransferase
MRDAVIVDAVRTPVGKGKAGSTLAVGQIGEQSGNTTRWAALAAGLPESVPAVTVDRQCGSSQQGIHFAAHGVISGAYDVVIASGVESMSHVTIGSQFADQDPFGPGVAAR